MRTSGLFFTAALCAQAQSKPAFEVASIKPATAAPAHEIPRVPVRTSPTTLIMNFVSLDFCIGWAYNVPNSQIAGDKLPGGFFEISAKTPAPASRDEMRVMLQSLLAERFHLALHREKRSMSVYALVQGKNPKLERAEGDADMVVSPPQGNKPVVAFEHSTMAEFSGMLSDIMRTPVIDATGLSGRFNFRFDMSRYMGGGLAEVDGLHGEGAVFFVAVQDQFGLKLERRKMDVEVLVIDHAEKLAEN